MNYEQFVSEVVKSLVYHVEDVVVKTASHDDGVTLQVFVNKDDLGRVIGRSGRVANSIRTIVHASAARNGEKVEILIEANEK